MSKSLSWTQRFNLALYTMSALSLIYNEVDPNFYRQWLCGGSFRFAFGFLLNPSTPVRPYATVLIFVSCGKLGSCADVLVNERTTSLGYSASRQLGGRTISVSHRLSLGIRTTSH